MRLVSWESNNIGIVGTFILLVNFKKFGLDLSVDIKIYELE